MTSTQLTREIKKSSLKYYLEHFCLHSDECIYISSQSFLNVSNALLSQPNTNTESDEVSVIV